MDNKKREKNLTITLLGLAAASIGMFAYSNLYVPNVQDDDKAKVYIAAENIPAHVKLEKEMFKSIQVSKNSVINGSVTNLNQVVGKQLDGKLEKGELLFSSRIATKEEEQNDGNLISELLTTTSLPLANNDSIRVYVQYGEKDKNFKVEELFHEKKVVSREKVSDNTVTDKVSDAANTSFVSTQEDGSDKSIFIRLTDEEALKYQEAENTGSIFVVKIVDPENDKSTNNGSLVSERKANKSDKENDADSALARYSVVKGDDIKTIAKKFMTTPEKIADLNNQKTAFNIGDIIYVPAN